MKITTIITSLNSVKHIKNAIESFLIQNYIDKELIIFDGMSTDGTHDIIDFYQKQHHNIIWVKEKDIGISDARNKAILHATGNYIGFLGADDQLLPGIYNKIEEYITLYKKPVDVIQLDSLINNNNTLRPIYCCHAITRARYLPSNVWFSKKNFLCYFNIAPGEAYYYNKSIFNDLSFDIQNKMTMDFQFNIKLLKQKRGNLRQILIPYFGILNNFDDHNISSIHAHRQFIQALKWQYKYFGFLSIPFILCRSLFYFLSLLRQKLRQKLKHS